jgi:hypothetical protein
MQESAKVRPVLKKDLLDRINESGIANWVGFVPDSEYAAYVHVAND